MGTVFKLYIPSTNYIQKIRNIWLYLIELKLLKKLIFQKIDCFYKRGVFFVLQIAVTSFKNTKNTKIWYHANSFFQANSYEGLRVPFVVSWCKFLNSVILKTFNEIVLAFLSVESKTNILYVNINFIGNLLLGFGRYYCKMLLFWATALTNSVFSIFFHVDPY